MRKIVAFFLFLSCIKSNAQDTIYARKIVDTLCSKTFWGRGYTNNGMQKAALYLQEEFKQIGLQPMSGKNFFQTYKYNVNSFPGKMKLNINGKDLVEGKDFIIKAESKGKKCNGLVEESITNENKKSKIFIDKKNNVVFSFKDKLTMHVADEENDVMECQLLRQNVDTNLKKYSLHIENKFIKNFKANNICGVVKGTKYPDSVLVLSAHYDHLGGLGANAYFPGANDNASGVSLLLNVAKYYAKNPQPYTMAFILFSGEEAGLLGSKYFVENPLIDLTKIKFLLNTDLAGTGVEGITVCNATVYPKQFEILQQINTKFNLLKAVNPRGKAANSDHYWFTEKGVPAFFFYTLGGIGAYHDVFDIAATLPLNEHADLFKLIIEFNKRIMDN